MSAADALERLRAAADDGRLTELARRYGVALITVFGSAVRTPERARDLDVAVSLLAGTDGLLALVGDLADLTASDDVDVLVLPELGLVTHVTLRELRTAGGPSAAPGTRVHACENPQVVQAAADRGAPGPLICLQGNPSAAGALLIERLLADGARLRYHGDFDWPGLAIAGRVLVRGAMPWRLTAQDYLASLPAGAGVSLTGPAVPTPWDPALHVALREHGRAVHEEAVLPILLADLASGSG